MLKWREQVLGVPHGIEIDVGVVVDRTSKALRFAPLATVPGTGVWPSAAASYDAALSGGWIAGDPYVSPVNPYSFRTDDHGVGAWIDVDHDDTLSYLDGITIWLDLVVHAITARSIIFTTGSTDANEHGSFSLEVQPPANGNLIRAWLIDDAGAYRYFGSSASFSSGIVGFPITPEEPFSLAFTMGPDGAFVAKDGAVIATLPTTLTWRAVGKRFGAWTNGAAQIDATLGGMRFCGALSPAQIAMIHVSQQDWRARLA